MPPNPLQTYGYHNTFHTHSQPQLPTASPPTYDSAISARHVARAREPVFAPRLESPPQYTCDVHFEGFLAIRAELASPFLMSCDTNWHSVYVILQGTQLSIYRVKSHHFFRSRPDTAGRLIKTYSLQHAEVGLAADWKAGELVPKSSLAKIFSTTTQERLYETDPELFEPIREWVMRLRLENEQFLLCAPTHEGMLDWIEQICSGIDISQPLEDRNEPRYRSLPRRTRRQRQIEASALRDIESLNADEIGRRLVAQQERLIRRLYPHLAADVPNELNECSNEDRRDAEAEPEAEAGDPDADDLDPADAQEDAVEASPSRPGTASRQRSAQTLRDANSRREPYDPKNAPPRPEMSVNAMLRFRRRCCPILLASSPRASPIIYVHGRRYQMDSQRQTLTLFELNPPRYDASTAPSLPPKPASLEEEGEEEVVQERPCLNRGISHATYASGVSSWTSPDVEGAEGDLDVSSVHSSSAGSASRFYSSLEELDRIPSTATDYSQTPNATKGKSILFTVRTVRSTTKAPQSHERDEITTDFTAHTPFLV